MANPEQNLVVESAKGARALVVRDVLEFPRAVLVAMTTSVILGACDRIPSVNWIRPAYSVAAAPADSNEYAETYNDQPTFEQQGRWSEGYRRARGREPGVVVGPGSGNPNVFAQAFVVQPGERFKVRARARSDSGQTALARIQVNWTDSQGRFLSVSSKAFAVGASESVAELMVEAPAGSSSGTLYVVGGEPDSVVRYTEMRLLRPSSPRSGSVAGMVSRSGDSAMSESKAGIDASTSGIPRPPNLTPLDASGRELSVSESQYYFYQASKALQRRAKERGADFVMYVMPDYNIARLWPAIEQLRREGVKVLAYEPRDPWTSGVDPDWYWQKADSHWTEAAVRLTADELLRMWTAPDTANRPFSSDLAHRYDAGFPQQEK